MQNSMNELQSGKQDFKGGKDNVSPKKGEFHLPGMKQKSNNFKDRKSNSKNEGL